MNSEKKNNNKLQTFSDLHRLREFSTPTFTERITKVYTSAKGKIKEEKNKYRNWPNILVNLINV